MNKSTFTESKRSLSASTLANKFTAGFAALALSATVVSTTQALVLTGNTITIAPTGVLDVKLSNVIVKSGSLATFTGYIKTGLTGGPNTYWDGPGVTSSNAAGNPSFTTAVGIVNNADTQYGTWPPLEPHAVLLTDILFKYTWWGDADLNGVVDGADYGLIDVGNGSGGALGGWLFGDFDYNGTIDGADYGLIDVGNGGQLGPLVSQGSVQSVPEPGMASLAMVGLLGFVARRNRAARSAASTN